MCDQCSGSCTLRCVVTLAVLADYNRALSSVKPYLSAGNFSWKGQAAPPAMRRGSAIAALRIALVGRIAPRPQQRLQLADGSVCSGSPAVTPERGRAQLPAARHTTRLFRLVLGLLMVFDICSLKRMKFSSIGAP